MNPLTDELSDDIKAELAAIFAELKRSYPPVQMRTIQGHTFMNPVVRRPWQIR